MRVLAGLCSRQLQDLKVLDLVDDVMRPVLLAEEEEEARRRLCRYGMRCRSRTSGTCPLTHVAVDQLPCPYYTLPGGCQDHKCKYKGPHRPL